MSRRTNHPNLQHAVDRELEKQIVPTNVEFYFANSKAPEYIPEIRRGVASFLKYHENKRDVVIVTSGGTTVPLENNTVRFIDNFSAGTRGSVSAEWFIKHGYAVIFLHREFSLTPFSQKYSSQSILELLEIVDGEVRVRPQYEASLKSDVERYEAVTKQNLLLKLPFTTVHQYLHTLRMLGEEVRPYGSSIMFYLAAAVSDFFLPMSKISEHKIQSHGSAKLVIDLDPVPKILRSLTQEWTPRAMVVSFKLETDPDILLSKCRGALEKYGHQLVVGNLLQTRKEEVFLVTPAFETKIVRANDATVEEAFLPKVFELHQEYKKTLR